MHIPIVGRHGRRALAAGVTIALLWVAPAHAPAAIEEIPGGIDALLEARGRAFVTGDETLLVSTLEPGAFAESQVQALRNARGVPLAALDLEASTRFSGDLASPRVRRGYPAGEVRTYHVVEESRFDVERLPFVEDSAYTFVRGGGGGAYEGWRLASVSDLEPLGFFSSRSLWDEGPLSVSRSERFLLLAHPDEAASLEPVLEAAEAAYAAAQRFWPQPVDERYVIIVPSTRAELGRILRATVDLTKFVAFAGGTVDRETGWEPMGVRLFLNRENLRRYDRDGQSAILAHELLHAFTRPVAGPFVPVWVEEGLAMAGSEQGDGLGTARGGPRPVDFPADEEFTAGPVGGIVRTYGRSQVAVQVLIDRFGVDGLARFYEALGAARIAAGTQEHHLDRATRDALDWSSGEWREAWLARLG